MGKMSKASIFHFSANWVMLDLDIFSLVLPISDLDNCWVQEKIMIKMSIVFVLKGSYTICHCLAIKILINRKYGKMFGLLVIL